MRKITLFFIFSTISFSSISREFVENNQSFILKNSDSSLCFGFDGNEDRIIKKDIDDNSIISSSCGDVFNSVRNTFIYKDGRIQRDSNISPAELFGNYKNSCAEVFQNNDVKAKECSVNNSKQIFKIERISGNSVKILNNGKCLTLNGSSSYLDHCANQMDNQIFTISDIKDPVEVRIVNRGWFNASVALAAVDLNNDNGGIWGFWADQPDWMQLDQVRYSYYSANAEVNMFTLKSDFGQDHEFHDVIPGDKYEVQIHGTIFNKSMKVIKTHSGNRIPNNQYAYIYEHAGYKGRTVEINEDIPDLSRNEFNDVLSSYRIPKGTIVVFYEHANYKGKMWTRTHDEYYSPEFNDIISSVKIRKNN
ncbi:beta/gamma crystallin-related protein [uncultured Aliivibrio sp.]|uniref:beta/gamma crystallin-related protein n=1 Tax=uncultured Aliivibrio sp. TaxID=873085 RepID=UPI0026294B62|nr:beta/gamma crystallin-related protein [uncultured Aliivibrio sp.]